jgi:tetratricopeptide (TPR) repeat protein
MISELDRLFSAGQLDEAMARAEESLSQSTDVEYCSDLGRACMGWGRLIGSADIFELGVDAFTKAIDVSPPERLSDCYESRGSANALLGRLDDAIADYDESIARGDAPIAVHLSRAEVLMWVGHYVQALSSLQSLHGRLETEGDKIVWIWMMCHALNFQGKDPSAYQGVLQRMAVRNIQLGYSTRDIEHYLKLMASDSFTVDQIENAWRFQRMVTEVAGQAWEA